MKDGPITVKEMLLVTFIREIGTNFTSEALEAAMQLCAGRVDDFDENMPFDDFQTMLIEVLKKISCADIPDVFKQL